MNPTEKPLTVELGGQRHTLHFNLNTFAAFEPVAGKHFLEFIGTLQDAFEQYKGEGGSAMSLLRRFSMIDFQALIWAALHTYDAQGEPKWPYTLHQVGRLVDLNSLTRLVPQVLTGNVANMPTEDEVDKGDTEARPPEPEARTGTPDSGGEPSGPSDEDVLASLTHSSDG